MKNILQTKSRDLIASTCRNRGQVFEMMRYLTPCSSSHTAKLFWSIRHTFTSYVCYPVCATRRLSIKQTWRWREENYFPHSFTMTNNKSNYWKFKEVASPTALGITGSNLITRNIL